MGYASVPAIGRFQKLIELKQRTTLRGEVLFVSRAAGISDERVCHMAICNVKGSLIAINIVPFK